jgi:p-hydroxybenzoate 3-monooxygenase
MQEDTTMDEKTTVAIIGAGPSGLTLSWALTRAGIANVIIENKSRDYILGRVRAGVLEQSVVDYLDTLGVTDNLRRDGLVHSGVYLQWAETRHHLNFDSLCGRHVVVYGQQELVGDLFTIHDDAQTKIFLDASDVTLHHIDSKNPHVTFSVDGEQRSISATYIAGTDGFHGVSRPSFPTNTLKTYQKNYPYAWLGILAEVEPSTDELIYALHPRGFAMHSMRSEKVSRLYLQVPVDDTIERWTDDAIWDELETRLHSPGWSLKRGPIFDRGITPMRSFVAEPMQFGSLFLAGDSAHIVPPTGAKGLNSALADVALLAEGIIEAEAGSDLALANYGAQALERQWKVQQFSQWMTELFHRDTREEAETAEFSFRSQIGRLSHLFSSPAAQRNFAEQYSGLPL